jgi:RND family efflux transporter MFP subunit
MICFEDRILLDLAELRGMSRKLRQHKWWVLGVAVVLSSFAALKFTGFGVAQEERKAVKPQNTGRNGKSPDVERTVGAPTRVAVVKPQTGGIARISEQPGTMESFDFADLYAKISGYVKHQTVDIGSKVSAGDVLVEIDAPEYEEAVNEAAAAVAQAEAQVTQMEARVDTAKAELESAQANIVLAEAELDKAAAYLRFREIQFDRVTNLFKRKSIDERLVDEKHQERDAAQAAENSARASIAAAKSQVVAATARIASAQADVSDAKAKVRLAKARESRARVFVDYTRIVSPYNGVVTRRSFHVGDFIRAADQGGAIPLLTVSRTDLMRVIVQVPERDVPYTDVGDAAIVSPNVLEHEKFQGRIARLSNSEDRVTRTMRAEIDLPNPKNRLRDGMFCRVAISLDAAAKGLKVPSSSVFVDRQTKKTAVYVVAEGKARRTPVEVGQDDGQMVEIVSGLSPKDLVVQRPTGALADNTSVEVD